MSLWAGCLIASAFLYARQRLFNGDVGWGWTDGEMQMHPRLIDGEIRFSRACSCSSQ